MEENRYLSKGKGIVSRFFGEFSQLVQNIWMFFKEDWREIFSFIFICMTVSLLATRLLDWLVSVMFSRLSGFAFVTSGNLESFLKTPVSWLAIFIYLIFATLFSLFELSGLLHSFSTAQIGRKTDLQNMIRYGFRTVKKTLHPKNWLIIPYLIILMPLTGFSVSVSGYKAAVPYFMIEGFESNPSSKTVFLIAYFLFVLAEMLYIFSINMYVLEDTSFLKSMKNARKLIEGRVLKTIMMMLVLTIAVNILINSVASALPTNFAELLTLFSRTENRVIKSIHLGRYVYITQKLLKNFFEPMITTAGLTALFYRYIDEKELLVKLSRDAFNAREYRARDTAKYVIGMLAVILLVFGIQVWHYRYLLEPVQLPVVCAHRGDSVHAPENTLPAFELALLENTPMVECDVIEAADGTVVVSHDNSLSRLTGHSTVISKSTLAEVQKYPLLPSLPGHYSDVRIPTLDDLLALMNEEDTTAEIQIELKPTKDDRHLEEEVVRLIHKYNMKDRCYVISMHYEPLLKIKEIDPEIRTGVAVLAAWDTYTDVKGVDLLSAADSTISPDLVKAMHEKGFKVMVWTVDDMDAVQYLVSCGVDVIGTNDPVTIQEAVDLARADGGISRIFYVLLHMFRGTEDSSLLKGKAS